MTTIYIALAIGAQNPAYPAYVAFRTAYRFNSGKVVVLPEPDPVALAEDGTGVVSVDPGVWIVDEILPTQVLRRAVVVPESTGTVQYADLVEVTNPVDIGYGPSWAHTAAEAAAEARTSAIEIAAAVKAIKGATTPNDAVIAAILADTRTASRKIVQAAIQAAIEAAGTGSGSAAPTIRPVMVVGTNGTVGNSAGSLVTALSDGLLAFTGVRPPVVKAAGVNYSSSQMLTELPAWLKANGPGVVVIEPSSVDARITSSSTPSTQEGNLRKMVGQLLQAGIQPILMTRWRLSSAAANAAATYNPAIYDSTTDAEVIATNDLIRSLASSMKVPVVDLQAILDGLADYLAGDKVELNAYGYSIAGGALAAAITHNPIPNYSTPTPGEGGGYDNGYDTGY